MSDQKPPENAATVAGSSGQDAADPDTRSEAGGAPVAEGRGTELAANRPGKSTDAGGPATSPRRTGDGPPATRQHTRIGAAWAAVAVAVVVLVVLLVFILQNLHQVSVRFFGAQGRFPAGVLVLFSAAGGALVVLVLGAARMIQLRWLARRDRQAAQKS